MPQDEEIIVEIDSDGKVQVKTQGFRGKKCIDAAKQFEKALGKIESTKLTQEYHLKESHQVKINQQNGK